jgi:hypothetical protein
MRTNKEKLNDVMTEYLDNMKKDISRRMKNQIGNDNWHKHTTIKTYETVLINAYLNCINWVSMYDTEYPLAWVRTDLIEKNLAVPVGEDYYGDKKPLPYRWVDAFYDGDEDFQVLYAGVWVDAQSIDWVFTEK